MYRPNFCAECGERLTRRGWRALISARFCSACDRRLGRSTYAKKITIVAIVGALAFGTGRYLLPPGPPLIIQRAANSPLSDLPLNLNDSPRPATRRDSTKPNPETLNPPPADDNAYICGARTKKGTPCHRHVHVAGERCFQHKGMPAILPLDKLLVKSK